jgi:hypothetical protein
MWFSSLLLSSFFLAVLSAHADEKTVPVNSMSPDEIGEFNGSISLM